MGPSSYMQSVVDRNVVMRRIPVFLSKEGDTGFQSLTYTSGRAVALWLWHHATNRQVAGSIPDGVIGIFQ